MLVSRTNIEPAVPARRVSHVTLARIGSASQRPAATPRTEAPSFLGFTNAFNDTGPPINRPRRSGSIASSQQTQARGETPRRRLRTPDKADGFPSSVRRTATKTVRTKMMDEEAEEDMGGMEHDWNMGDETRAEFAMQAQGETEGDEQLSLVREEPGWKNEVSTFHRSTMITQADPLLSAFL